MTRDDKHVGFNPIYFPQTDLIDLVRSQCADGGAAAYVIQVAPLTAGQRDDSQSSAPVRRVLRSDEITECLVCGQNLAGDHLRYLYGQALLIIR